MKKLNKLEINSEKLMKNEELLTLRGGYGSYCTCRNSSDEIICESSVIPCAAGACDNWCKHFCPGSDSSVCAGW